MARGVATRVVVHVYPSWETYAEATHIVRVRPATAADRGEAEALALLISEAYADPHGAVVVQPGPVWVIATPPGERAQRAVDVCRDLGVEMIYAPPSLPRD